LLEPAVDTGSFFDQRPALLTTVLVLMFLSGLAVRLVGLDRPGMLVDRDFTSAMFARSFYYEGRDDVPEWRRQIAQEMLARQPALEPPVTEWLASLVYRAADREDLRLARLLTVLFWMAGGLFMLRVAQRLVGTDAAVFALGYYLFLPVGIGLSRSFQADALMMLLYLAGLDAIVRYHESPAGRWPGAASLIAAATVVYRPLVMPALVGAFAVPAMRKRGWLRGLIDRHTLIYVAVATIPAFAFYGYATFVARHFGWKLESSFVLSLYAHREYWQGWFEIAVSVLGITPLLLALAGVPWLRPGLPRAFVVGLGLGYLCFGLAFTYHIHTHGYYQAQLIPAIGIAAGPLVAFLANRVAGASERWVRILPPLVIGGVVGALWLIDVRESLTQPKYESAAVAARIGEIVGHSDRVVFVSRYYGLPLQYQGELTGTSWPRPSEYWLYRKPGARELTVAERLAALDFEPEYFVITHLAEYDRHHDDLRQYLKTRCAPIELTEDYLIYGSCETSLPG
jgi:hypothetical protein